MGLHWARARLGATLALGMLATTTPLGAQGNIRELDCRGNTGMVLRVEQDPSPRDTSSVTMVLEYKRATSATGGDPRTLDPGTCTWNPGGWPGFPVEPGRVRFDVPREAQPWSGTETRMMDTTVRAAVFYADPITLPRYLLDPRHYWKFYVDDATGFSPSSQALFESGTPTYVWITGPVRLANDVRRDLLCRGGTSGLLWGGGASVGNNLAKVQLTYRVSPTVPGKSGGGLAPGSCAWVDRTAMPTELGRIWFITASNAQLRQTQSGVPLDQSPTAAERYPDVRSIPAYLRDPARFWTFAVVSRAPDSALTHGAWKPDFGFLAGGVRDPGTSTVRTQPTTTGSSVFRPGTGSATTTSSVGTLFDIRDVTVTPELEMVTIRFEAAANSNPTVNITPASVGATQKLTVAASPAAAGMMRYVATPATKLPRGMSYNYGILAAATGNARQNSTSGTFKTLSQRMTIQITEINVINDGDSDSDGDLTVYFNTCTPSMENFFLRANDGGELSWGDGPQWVRIDLESTGEVPDQVRMVVNVEENDVDIARIGRTLPPTISCTRPNRPPGNNGDYEWNSTILDVDLTKYPGPKNGAPFVRRSQPPCCGTKLEFEIRGSWEVTRQ